MQGAMPLWPGRVLAALALIGAAITIGGGILLGLGGSAYYFLGGLAVTFGWAWWEVGANGWGLAPRLIGPAVIGLAFALLLIRRRLGRAAWVAAGTGAGLLPAQVAVAATSDFRPQDALVASIQPVAQMGVPGEWPQFGRDAAGARFSPLTQIGPSNVDQLERAWTYRTGVVQAGAKSALRRRR